MTVQGIIQFVSYIVRIYGRHVRINVRRYGIVGALIPSQRGRHAGTGHGVWANPFGRGHGLSAGSMLPAMDLVRRLQGERIGIA